jgi:diaminohydroxyphosphoribosylaminopyrimidine deaminase/5-amino-6-(5-phosphoribosylamino)uracil reductase
LVRLFSDVASGVDDPHLARAITLAYGARGATWPNPLVGCVVVADGEIVGEGSHESAGQPHAEINALRHAGGRARGAHVFVTLEPCIHFGKTPPCVDALIAAGVSAVSIGMPDPTREAGGGADRLRDAGIEVRFAAEPAPFEELNAGWLHRVLTGRPLVTAKVGVSLDARSALQSGQRATMTGASGAAVTRTLRSSADAVLVSAATVAVDDPALTVRDDSGGLAERQPLRVVLVRELAPPADARVFTDEAAETLVLSVRPDGAPCDVPTGVAHHACGKGGLDEAMLALGERGIGELLVEPGPRLLAALLGGRLLDRLVVITAGGMAGEVAPSMYAGPAQREGDVLSRAFFPLEAGIIGDVSVTVWSCAQVAANN